MEQTLEVNDKAHKHKCDFDDDEIQFTVDGEPYELELPKLTANEIIKRFGGKDPTTHYLVQIKRKEKVSYKDKGEELVSIHDCSQFQVISTGPTPVSDGRIRVGVDVFIEGLRELGYEPMVASNNRDHVIIDYEVPIGRFVDKKVRLGFIVPPDFPMTPPSGPHVSPHIHAINPNGEHPNGRVHDAPPSFPQGSGGEWQYWSRPFADWATSKKTVAAYMSHIWRLWDSQ